MEVPGQPPIQSTSGPQIATLSVGVLARSSGIEIAMNFLALLFVLDVDDILLGALKKGVFGRSLQKYVEGVLSSTVGLAAVIIGGLDNYHARIW